MSHPARVIVEVARDEPLALAMKRFRRKVGDAHIARAIERHRIFMSASQRRRLKSLRARRRRNKRARYERATAHWREVMS